MLAFLLRVGYAATAGHLLVSSAHHSIMGYAATAGVLGVVGSDIEIDANIFEADG
jgi:hypothetical protein